MEAQDQERVAPHRFLPWWWAVIPLLLVVYVLGVAPLMAVKCRCHPPGWLNEGLDALAYPLDSVARTSPTLWGWHYRYEAWWFDVLDVHTQVNAWP
jgi:hypothetical protein